MRKIKTGNDVNYVFVNIFETCLVVYRRMDLEVLLIMVRMQALEDSPEGIQFEGWILEITTRLIKFSYLPIRRSLVSPLASSGFNSPYGALGGNYLQGKYDTELVTLLQTYVVGITKRDKQYSCIGNIQPEVLGNQIHTQKCYGKFGNYALPLFVVTMTVLIQTRGKLYTRPVHLILKRSKVRSY